MIGRVIGLAPLKAPWSLILMGNCWLVRAAPLGALLWGLSVEPRVFGSGGFAVFPRAAAERI